MKIQQIAEDLVKLIREGKNKEAKDIFMQMILLV